MRGPTARRYTDISAAPPPMVVDCEHRCLQVGQGPTQPHSGYERAARLAISDGVSPKRRRTAMANRVALVEPQRCATMATEAPLAPRLYSSCACSSRIACRDLNGVEPRKCL